MVNTEMSEDTLSDSGEINAEVTEANSAGDESQQTEPSTTQTPSPPPNEESEATAVDESVRLSPTSLYCSVPLNSDVQSIIDTFPKTEGEKVGKKTRKLPCLYCDRTFVADNLRQKHVERSHSIKQARRSSSRFQQSAAIITCLYCNRYTLDENRLDDLFRHLVTEHPSKYFGCIPCNERFSLVSQLEEHNEYVHEIQRENKVQSKGKISDMKNSAITNKSVKTKHKTKIKKVIQSDVTRPNLRRTRLQVTQQELRSKRIALKSTKHGIKRSARIKDKVLQKKKRQKPKERVTEEQKSEKDKEIKVSSTENPYPTFDAFYRVKKITDHSIDNLRISSLTFNDVFDQAFFNRIKCNIRENLLNHIDGKLFKNEESESRISNFEKTQPEFSNTENYGCELSLNAATPIATSLLTTQFGDDPELQIEYGAKASKKKTTPKVDEVHYKYFTRRKYQASILESKENRDLSKLDMWTQFVIKSRQQKILNTSKTDREKIDYKKGDEYRAKKQNEELNRILDRRGPFEDLKEEATKKAALEGNYNREAHIDVSCILEDILSNVFSTIIDDVEIKTELTDSEIPSYLNLRKASLTNESYIDRSDKITLICSSQETENFEAPQIMPRDKNALVELTGEWARSRLYICAACGLKLANMKSLVDHKNIVHQNVWCQHYEFVGNQGGFYKHLSIPSLGKMGHIEESAVYKMWKRSDARVCTKCKKQCNSLGELHRHILECGEDWSWMLVRKKCKYKPFGAKTRRKRRGLFKRIIHKDKPSDENREKKTYKKVEGPRVKPSDADTIERMLANLPAKRATRKIMCLKDGFPKMKSSKSKPKKTENVTPNTTVPIKTKNMKIRRNRAEILIHESNKIMKGKMVKSGSKCNPVANLRKSVRNLNKVVSSKLIDSTTNLMVKRKLMNARHQKQQKKTRNSMQLQSTVIEAEEEKLEDKQEETKEEEVIVEEEVKDEAKQEVSQKVSILTRVQNFKKTILKIPKAPETENNNDLDAKPLRKTRSSTQISTDVKMSQSPIKKKACNKQNFGSKLMRTLSLRKKSKETEPSTQGDMSKVDTDDTKNNGKRKSKFSTLKNAVKKMKFSKASKTINTRESLANIIGHFLEEGSNEITSSKTAEHSEEHIVSVNENVLNVIEENETSVNEDVLNIIEQSKTSVNEDMLNIIEESKTSVNEDILNVVENSESKLNECAPENIVKEVPEEGDINGTSNESVANNEVPITNVVVKQEVIECEDQNDYSCNNDKTNIPKAKTKICKRAKGLNACIAMLTSKLQQKEDSPSINTSVEEDTDNANAVHLPSSENVVLQSNNKYNIVNNNIEVNTAELEKVDKLDSIKLNDLSKIEGTSDPIEVISHLQNLEKNEIPEEINNSNNEVEDMRLIDVVSSDTNFTEADIYLKELPLEKEVIEEPTLNLVSLELELTKSDEKCIEVPVIEQEKENIVLDPKTTNFEEIRLEKVVDIIKCFEDMKSKENINGNNDKQIHEETKNGIIVTHKIGSVKKRGRKKKIVVNQTNEIISPLVESNIEDKLNTAMICEDKLTSAESHSVGEKKLGQRRNLPQRKSKIKCNNIIEEIYNELKENDDKLKYTKQSASVKPVDINQETEKEDLTDNLQNEDTISPPILEREINVASNEMSNENSMLNEVEISPPILTEESNDKLSKITSDSGENTTDSLPPKQNKVKNVYNREYLNGLLEQKLEQFVSKILSKKRRKSKKRDKTKPLNISVEGEITTNAFEQPNLEFENEPDVLESKPVETPSSELYVDKPINTIETALQIIEENKLFNKTDMVLGSINENKLNEPVLSDSEDEVPLAALVKNTSPIKEIELTDTVPPIMENLIEDSNTTATDVSEVKDNYKLKISTLKIFKKKKEKRNKKKKSILDKVEELDQNISNFIGTCFERKSFHKNKLKIEGSNENLEIFSGINEDSKDNSINLNMNYESEVCSNEEDEMPLSDILNKSKNVESGDKICENINVHKNGVLNNLHKVVVDIFEPHVSNIEINQTIVPNNDNSFDDEQLEPEDTAEFSEVENIQTTNDPQIYALAEDQVDDTIEASNHLIKTTENELIDVEIKESEAENTSSVYNESLTNDTTSDNSKENEEKSDLIKRPKRLIHKNGSKTNLDTEHLQSEPFVTPLKENKNTDSSFIQTPDLNDTILGNRIKTKLKVKQGNKKKKVKITKKIEKEGESLDNFCEICNKMFVRSDSLIKHKRTLTHIAKLSEIEAREAELKAKLKEKEKLDDEMSNINPEISESNDEEGKINIESAAITEKSVENIDKESDAICESDLTKGEITNSILVASSFTLKANNDSLKLADIINDVLNKPVTSDNIEPFSDILEQKQEIKRYKSLGERKSFDSDTAMYTPSQNFTNHINNDLLSNKITNSTDAFLEKQISLLENIIEENKERFQYMDDISVASNKSDERCPSDMSLVSDIKQDDSNIIFSHNTNIVNSLIHSEANFIKPSQYEEISEDSLNTRNFEDQRSRKALNRDEELFLECCSLLKSSSEVSDYSKKSGRAISMVNNYGMKTGDEPDWMERKSFSPKRNTYPGEEYLSEDSRPDTPIGDNYNDLSNSNTIRTDWNSKIKDREFEDISLDSISNNTDNNSNFNSFGVFNDENTASRTRISEDNPKILDSNHSSFNTSFKNRHEEMLEVISKDSTDEENQSGKFEPTQTSISDYFMVSLPKKPGSCSDSLTNDSKKVMTKGAMKIFEGLKVSIPTEELDMSEVLNCSPTSKRLELESSEVIKDDKVNKLKTNLNKCGNKLGLKITKRRVRPKLQDKNKGDDDEKIHDVYDFEETQDNTDIFMPSNLRTFRTQIAEKNDSKMNGESDSEVKTIESDGESNHYIDSFSYEEPSASSYSTGTDSSVSVQKNTGPQNITKKKCVIMGRIFKNAFKNKPDEVKDIPVIDNSKLVENYVMNCPESEPSKQKMSEERIKMTEQEMDLLFDKLLEETASLNKSKSIDVDVTNTKLNEKSAVKNKQKNGKQKKRVRKPSLSSDDEFNLTKTPKKRVTKKKGKEKDGAINLEQELKECMGVAGRKSQRKCTSGKQNVLVEFWSSDDSDFEAMLLSHNLEQTTKQKEKAEIVEPKPPTPRPPSPVLVSLITSPPPQADFVSNEVVIDKSKELVSSAVESNIASESINPEFLREIVKDVKETKMKARRKSTQKPKTDKTEKMPKIKLPMTETLASNRRKRAAADTLYYWSSSSEDDSQNLIEIKSIRDENEDDDDRPMQHGWIVGDSPKKLVTMLAQAKGKKVDPKCVKEQSKKRTTI